MSNNKYEAAFFDGKRPCPQAPRHEKRDKYRRRRQMALVVLLGGLAVVIAVGFVVVFA